MLQRVAGRAGKEKKVRVEFISVNIIESAVGGAHGRWVIGVIYKCNL